MHNEIYLKAKIKCYNGKINTNSHNNKTLKEGSQFICLSLILIDSSVCGLQAYFVALKNF